MSIGTALNGGVFVEHHRHVQLQAALGIVSAMPFNLNRPTGR